jgi:hypothetical protein
MSCSDGETDRTGEIARAHRKDTNFTAKLLEWLKTETVSLMAALWEYAPSASIAVSVNLPWEASAWFRWRRLWRVFKSGTVA